MSPFLFSLVKDKYQKIKKFFSFSLTNLFSKKLDAAQLEKLEELLYMQDLGGVLVEELLGEIQLFYKKHPESTQEDFICWMKKFMLSLFVQTESPLLRDYPQGALILVVGVNGSGKTTTIGRLAHYYKNEGKKVLVAPGDTFRAAAKEQLSIWANRAKVTMVDSPSKDPAGVVYEALQKGQNEKFDLIIADTAGRLDAKVELMRELEKVIRTAKKLQPDAPHEVLYILDATLGQNGLDQLKAFMQVCPVSGICLTKMDGTAKGGVALRVQKELKIPILWVGLGEGLDDLQPFDANHFVESLF
ncbi:MAG: signal recognition particle-docking protein FtsY [Chlamydiae bacterium]|nr:signal recognition particle-docking protein FtsY [Chlamydiota bacterium]